ncbi:MAG TPA: TOBE domain-containing protein [Thermomicrobiales bacterium]|nr:TOBE domain-containing protein [Thermomicrobiales bacterium]
MELSARNQIPGTIVAVEIGVVTAEITVDIGNDQTIVSVITKGSAERLGLAIGDKVVAVLKATDVMIGKL